THAAPTADHAGSARTEAVRTQGAAVSGSTGARGASAGIAAVARPRGASPASSAARAPRTNAPAPTTPSHQEAAPTSSAVGTSTWGRAVTTTMPAYRAPIPALTPTLRGRPTG